jgi:flagellar basal-body rod protein FlgC
MRAAEISMSALDVEWRRLEVIAENLANANTANPIKGKGYSQLNLISGPSNDFAPLLHADRGIDVNDLQGVMVKAIVPGTAEPRLVHEPGSPNANAQGFVSYPAIDSAQQMTSMVETARIYEANVVAMTLAREMYSKALQLGSTR